MIINTNTIDYNLLGTCEALSFRLQDSYNTKSRVMMFSVYDTFLELAPQDVKNRKKIIAEEIANSELNKSTFLTNTHISVLSDEEIYINVKSAFLALNEKVDSLYAQQERYNYANKVMFESQTPFSTTQVLYKEEQKQLTVSNMLDVSKYAIKVAQILDPSNENYEKASAAIVVFQGIEHTLNNETDNGTPRKMLHLANDFLTGVVKSQAKNDEQKGTITGISILVDLAIDFFCKKQ